MALWASLRRLARLGFWVGVSAGAMLVDACSSSGSKLGQAKDAGPEAPAEDAPGIRLDASAKADAQAVDGGAVDGSSDAATDLWDTICE